MKQTIEIEISDGKKAVLKDNKIVFEDIKPHLPKTWEEFCETHPMKRDDSYIDCNSNIRATCREGCKRLSKSDKPYLPSKKASKQHLALMQLHQLRDCYRQGWKPDWTDEKKKFYISFWNNKTLLVLSTILIPHFLTFQTIELAEEFLNNFRELIKQAGDLI